MYQNILRGDLMNLYGIKMINFCFIDDLVSKIKYKQSLVLQGFDRNLSQNSPFTFIHALSDNNRMFYEDDRL